MFNNIYNAVKHIVFNALDPDQINKEDNAKLISIIAMTSQAFKASDITNWTIAELPALNRKMVFINIPKYLEGTIIKDIILYKGQIHETYMFTLDDTVDKEGYDAKNLANFIVSLFHKCNMGINDQIDALSYGESGPQIATTSLADSIIYSLFTMSCILGHEISEEMYNNVVEVLRMTYQNLIPVNYFEQVMSAASEVDYSIEELFDNSMYFAFSSDKYPSLFFNVSSYNGEDMSEEEQRQLLLDITKGLLRKDIKPEDLDGDIAGPVMETYHRTLNLYAENVEKGLIDINDIEFPIQEEIMEIINSHKEG